MNKEEIKHINWMYNRLISVHKENPNIDYMKRFKKIIDKQLALCSVSSSLSVGDDKADELIDKTIEKHKLKDIGSLTKKQCLRVGIAVGLMEEKLLKP